MIKQLEKEMKKLAKEEKFEEAMELQYKIEKIKKNKISLKNLIINELYHLLLNYIILKNISPYNYHHISLSFLN